MANRQNLVQLNVGDRPSEAINRDTRTSVSDAVTREPRDSDANAFELQSVSKKNANQGITVSNANQGTGTMNPMAAGVQSSDRA